MLSIKPKSIQAKITFYLFLSFAIFLIFLSLFIKSNIKHESMEVFKEEIVEFSKIIGNINFNNSEKNEIVNSKGLLIQVYNSENQLIYKSKNAPDTEVALGNKDIKYLDISNKEFMVYRKNYKNKVIIGIETSLYMELIEDINILLFSFLLVSFIFVFFLIRYIVSRSLKSLTDIKKDLISRDANNLSKIKLDCSSSEIDIIVNSINNMFCKIERLRDNEKRFTSNAAHELRTPLAGLKAQAQIAMNNPDRVDKSLKNIITSVDKSSNLIEQLLSLSKVDSSDSIKLEKVNINNIIKLISDEFPNRKIKLINMIKSGNKQLEVISDKNLNYILYRNIIENAMKYSPEKTDIDIIYNENSVTIKDQGCGIKESNLDKVYDRFFRENVNNQHGSGLGLSIVKRIADSLNLNININNNTNEKGLSVIVNYS